MAIGWLTLLKSVPWTDVISNAPKIADGAKKLWGAVAKKSQDLPDPIVQVSPNLGPEGAHAQLGERIEALEAATTNLHGQMLESSELIKALAEQNAQLIRHAELSRVRIAWLATAIAILGVIAVVSLYLLLTRFAAV